MLVSVLAAVAAVGVVVTAALAFRRSARMAAQLGVGAYLTFDISHVFTGALRVKPDAFTSAQQMFPQIPESR